MFLNQRTSLSLSSEPDWVLMSQGMCPVSPANTLTTSTLSEKCIIIQEKSHKTAQLANCPHPTCGFLTLKTRQTIR